MLIAVHYIFNILEIIKKQQKKGMVPNQILSVSKTKKLT